MGTPTTITMIDFTYNGNFMKARLLINNPDINGKWLSVKVKAFAGTES